MNATTKLALYGGVLAASFAVAAGIGTAVGPIDTGDETVHHDADTGDIDAGHEAVDGPATAQRPGTSLDARGFRLVPDVHAVAAGQAANYTFTIVDESGRPVTAFEPLHERDLHLIVASRDLVTYHHLHPERDHRGTWAIDLPSLPVGSYRIFADASPTGSDQVTLGVDLAVAEVVTTGSPPPVVTTSVVDEFEITLSTAVSDDESQTYEFTVERGDEPVTVEPYLGALGHLVALRAGDLAYVHVHATETTAPAIGFAIEFPTPGTYRLFLDFSVDGTVHTADFTVEAPQLGDRDMNTDMNDGIHATDEQGH